MVPLFIAVFLKSGPLLLCRKQLDLHKTPFASLPSLPLNLFGPETVSSVFDASLEDVRELERILAIIRKRMEELEKGVKR